jgi:hypothetical protein
MNHGVAITVTGGSSKPYASRPCSDCEKEGIKSPAHRILPSGRGLCLMHFERVGLRGVAPPERPFVMEPIPKKELRERLAPKREVANEEERNIVPKKSNVDWNAVQNERAAGLLTIAEIAKKYGTSDASVYAHTKGNGRKAAGGGARQRESRVKEAA